MKKDDIDLELLENADEETVKKLAEKYRGLSADDAARLYRRSEEIYRNRMKNDEYTASGVEMYRRPVWHKLAAAAAVVLMAAGAGIGGLAMLNNMRSLPDKTPMTDAAATTECTETKAASDGADEVQRPASALESMTIDMVRFARTAKLPSFYIASEETVKTLAGAMNFSEWKEISEDTPVTGEDFVEMFVYNNGDIQRFVFYYSDNIADHITGGTKVRYSIPESVTRAVTLADITSEEDANFTWSCFDRITGAIADNNAEPLPQSILEPMPDLPELAGRTIIDTTVSDSDEYDFDTNSLSEIGKHSWNVVSGTVDGYTIAEEETPTSYCGELLLNMTVTEDANGAYAPGDKIEVRMPVDFFPMKMYYGDQLYASGGGYLEGAGMTAEEIENTYYRWFYDSGEVPIPGRDYALFITNIGDRLEIVGYNTSMLYKYNGMYLHKNDKGKNFFFTMDDLKSLLSQSGSAENTDLS